jgi:hypothetical protein
MAIVGKRSAIRLTGLRWEIGAAPLGWLGAAQMQHLLRCNEIEIIASFLSLGFCRLVFPAYRIG